MKRAIESVFVAAAILVGANANAGLNGDTVQLHWVWGGDQVESVLVGPGVEVPFWIAGTWDVGDNYIDFTASNTWGLGQGLVWKFTSLDYGGITGVSVSTNFENWNDSMVTFSSDSIVVTFANQVDYKPMLGHIRLTMESNPSAVPEPSQYALLSAGLAVIACGLRRRRRTA